MAIDKHIIAVLNGSSSARSDRELLGKKYYFANNSSAGPISSVTVNAAGFYTSIPTPVLSGNGSGASLSLTMKAGGCTIATAQSGSGSYNIGDTIPLAGGTFTTAAVLTVATTQVQSATVAAGGSGGTNGTQTVTGTTGTGTKFQASVTISGGAITAINSITTPGVYTVNPTTLTAEPVTGAGLTGATLNIKMGVLSATTSVTGSYTVLPTNPVSQASTSGTGTGATFNVAGWGINTVVVGSGGAGYDNTSTLTFSGGGINPINASATLNLNNTNNSVTVPIAFNNLPLNSNSQPLYGVFVNPGQDCRWYVPQNSKTNSGFNVVLVPTTGTAIAAGNIDVMVNA